MPEQKFLCSSVTVRHYLMTVGFGIFFETQGQYSSNQSEWKHFVFGLCNHVSISPSWIAVSLWTLNFRLRILFFLCDFNVYVCSSPCLSGYSTTPVLLEITIPGNMENQYLVYALKNYKLIFLIVIETLISESSVIWPGVGSEVGNWIPNFLCCQFSNLHIDIF